MTTAAPQITPPPAAPAPSPRPSLPERTALAAAVGAFFFLVYGGCLYVTAFRPSVPRLYFEWERHIPYVPWMIFPYMSIDLFFVGAFYVCRTRDELHTLAKRLALALVVAGACFLFFPLEYGFTHPKTGGWLGATIESLKGVDRPFNLAPSLHIAFRSILWIVFIRHSRGLLRTGLAGWFILIGLSTLLVFQHHLFDVVTGQLLAMFCIYLLPEQRRPHPVAAPRPRLALRYAIASAACVALGAILSGWGWLALWPAASLAFVAYAYATGREIFHKSAGRLPPSTRAALAPYLVILRTVRLLQFRRRTAPCELVPHLWIGGHPAARDWRTLADHNIRAAVDLTAELETRPPHGTVYHNVPIPDLLLPTPDTLAHAVDTLRRAHRLRGGAYLHCALGYGRTAVTAAAYLLAERHAATVEDAITRVRACRPRSVFPPRARELLAQFAESRATPDRPLITNDQFPMTSSPT